MNTSIFHARRVEQYRPRSNDERLADWACKFFGAGYHRRPSKPRVRAAASLPATAPAQAGKDSK